MMNRFLTFACLCLFSTQGFSGTYCNAIPEYLSVGQEYSTRPKECTQSNRPSAICDVTLKRTATLVGRGSSEAILSFNVRTTDTENPHRLKGINIDLKGSTNITVKIQTTGLNRRRQRYAPLLPTFHPIIFISHLTNRSLRVTIISIS